MTPENLNLYYIFYITALTGNISNAAKRLYISQPAVSKAIARLEKNLEVTLFTRSSRGVKLTQEGELLCKQLKEAFSSIEKGEETIKKSIQLGMGQLSIGVSTTLCKYVLLPMLPAFRKGNPYVRLSISCQSTNNTLLALEREELDIGLVGEPEKANGCNFYPIRQIQDIFVTTEQYLAQISMEYHSMESSDVKQSTALSQIAPPSNAISLENVTLLLLDKDNVTRQYIEKYFMNQRMAPSSILEISTMDLLIEFAKAGLGVACVIGDFVEKELEEGSLIQFPVNTPIPPRKIGFACKSNTNPTPVMEKFMQLFIPDGSDLK